MEEQVNNEDQNKGNERQAETEQKVPAKTNSLLLAGIVLLLCIPLIYLFFSGPKKQEQEGQAQDQQTSNLAVLEQNANTNPTLQNLITLGIAYQQNNMLQPSIRVFNRALELNPRNAVVLNNLGVSFIMNKQFDEADSVLNMALEVDSTFQLARNNINWGKMEKDMLMEKIAKAEAIPVAERKPKDYLDLGLDYFSLKQYEKSIELFKECLKLDPSNSLAYNNMGTSYMFLRNYKEAEASFQKAIELDDSMQLFKNNLAWARDEMSKESAPATK